MREWKVSFVHMYYLRSIEENTTTTSFLIQALDRSLSPTGACNLSRVRARVSNQTAPAIFEIFICKASR